MALGMEKEGLQTAQNDTLWLAGFKGGGWVASRLDRNFAGTRLDKNRR